MTNFICPKCKAVLQKKDNSFICKNNHSYDISKENYVNLLLSNSKKRHGDDKLMVLARKDFLDGGYYNTLADKFVYNTAKYTNCNDNLLDIGCGEGFYSYKLYENLYKNQKLVSLFGIDISKEALKYAGKRIKNSLDDNSKNNISLAVSSGNVLPFLDNSFNVILNIFAPIFIEETLRVLKKGGYLIRIIPRENHLLSLKKQLYKDVLLNKISEDLSIDGFNLLEKISVDERILINNNKDILNLFKMTPYYYKTSKEDQDKLNFLESLECELNCLILIYIKQ